MSTYFIEDDGPIFMLDRNLGGYFYSRFTQRELRSYYTKKAKTFWHSLPELHRLVVLDDSEKLEKIVSAININQQDSEGRTPFWYACSPYSPKCFGFLLKKWYVDNLTASVSGVTPLRRLCQDATCEMLRTYLQYHSQEMTTEALRCLNGIMFTSKEQDAMLELLTTL